MTYPMIAYLDKDGTMVRQLTGKADVGLFDKDTNGNVIGCTRALKQAIAAAKIDNLPITFHIPGQAAGIAVAENDDVHEI